MLQVAAILHGSHSASFVQVQHTLVGLNTSDQPKATDVHVDDTAVLRFDPMNEDEAAAAVEESTFPAKCTYFIDSEAAKVALASEALNFEQLLLLVRSYTILPTTVSLGIPTGASRIAPLNQHRPWKQLLNSWIF